MAGHETFVNFSLHDLSEENERAPSGSIRPTEIVSTDCAGAYQLLMTNPMKISKIRIQMQGETTAKVYQEKEPASRGATACISRNS